MELAMFHPQSPPMAGPTNPPCKPTSIDSLVAQLQEMKATIGDIQQQVAAQKRGRGKGLKKLDATNKPPGNKDCTPNCYRCTEVGHFGRDCPRKAEGKHQRTPPRMGVFEPLYQSMGVTCMHLWIHG